MSNWGSKCVLCNRPNDGSRFGPASIASVDLVRAEWFESKAIGKVVTANGSVTIEHTGAVVVEAATGGNGHAKVGDFIYQGMWCRLALRARSGLSSSTVPPSILPAMPASP